MDGRFKLNNKHGQKFKINEECFTILNTELLAYCLGFLYADGSLGVYNGDFSIRVSLKEEDIEILNFFKQAFQSDRPIRKERGYPTFKISNKRIYLDLLKLGLSDNKTYKIRFPNEDIVPANLREDFVRGFFDGDGSIARQSKRISNMRFSFVSNFQFLDGIQKFLIENGFSKTKICGTKSEGIGILCYTGANNCERFFNLMYKNKTFFLKRKKDRFIRYLQENNKNKIKPFKLINPQGDVVEVKTFRELQESGGPCKQSIYKLLGNQREQVSGWRLYKNNK